MSERDWLEGLTREEQDAFYEAHACPRCGCWCDDEDCECPPSCFAGAAVEHSRPFVAVEPGR